MDHTLRSTPPPDEGEAEGRHYRGSDRRKRPTPPISRYAFFGGRRFTHRRSGEAEDAYVDLYNHRLVVFLLVFFVLTVIDSVSTLIYLDKGGRELNPMAQWMIEQGDTFFILCKGILTGACIVFVMIHKNFKYSRIAIFIGFSFYFLLALYHMVLQLKSLL